MVDPFSILGIFGLCLSIIGFVAGTTEQVVLRGQAYREYDLRKDECLHQLIALRTKFIAWLKIWYQLEEGRFTPYASATYEHFWGSDGFENIQGRLRVIDHLIRKAAKYVGVKQASLDSRDLISQFAKYDCGHTNLENRPRSLAQIELNANSLPTGSFLTRLEATFYKFAKMNGILGRLHRQLEDLSSHSSSLFKHFQFGRTEQLSAGYIRRIVDINHELQDFDSFAIDLHAHADCLRARHHVSCLDCFIELRTPEILRSFGAYGSFSFVHLDFAIETTGVGGLPDLTTSCWRKRLEYQRSKHGLHHEHYAAICGDFLFNGIESSLIQDHSRDLPRPEARAECIKTALLEESQRTRNFSESDVCMAGKQRRSYFDHSRHRKFDVDRAQAVVGIADWTVTLWNSPWLRNICSCKIKTLIISRDEKKFVFCSEQSSAPETCACDLGDFGELFRLGLVLAELALVRPLTVIGTDDFETTFSNGSEIFTKSELLQMVREAVVSPEYCEVVNLCFDMDRRTRFEKLEGHQISYLQERIVLPLQKYQKETDDFIKRLRN